MAQGGWRLVFGDKTWLMGIINVTPDSFSGDGLVRPGRSQDEVVSAALEHWSASTRAMVPWRAPASMRVLEWSMTCGGPGEIP